MWNLRVQRIKNHMSLQDLAEKVGTNASAISRWELGKNEPRISTIRKLAEILNCTIDELLEDTDERVS